MTDEKVVQLAEKHEIQRLPDPQCRACGGSGVYVFSRAEHAHNCGGSCEHCPIEVQDYAECDCFSYHDGALAAIREAYDVGRRDGPQWIPVNERLPEIKKHGDQFFSEDVLVVDDDGALTIEFFSNGRWSGSTDTDHWTVTHWMELPTPPASIRDIHSTRAYGGGLRIR